LVFQPVKTGQTRATDSTQLPTRFGASQITTALSNVGVFTYGYDPKGNQINVNSQGSLTTMQYDYENRLSSYENSSTAVTYLYYTNNMKAIELVNGSTTSLIWDGTRYLQGRN
jgi:hypothetical protein